MPSARLIMQARSTTCSPICICPVTGPVLGAFVLQPCPGQSPGPVCTPGASLLSAGARLYDNLEQLAGGCCACRTTKSSGTTTVYGGTHFDVSCAYPDLAPAPLAPNTVVHYTGMLLQDQEGNECPKTDYAEVVLVSPLDNIHHTFWVQAADLMPCHPSRTCTTTSVEIGASCNSKACCTAAAEGGHPNAVCYQPEGDSFPKTCGVPPSPGEMVSTQREPAPHCQSPLPSRLTLSPSSARLNADLTVPCVFQQGANQNGWLCASDFLDILGATIGVCGSCDGTDPETKNCRCEVRHHPSSD